MERGPVVKIAVLDDYADVALSFGDWSAVTKRGQISVFNQHLAGSELVAMLQPFDLICTLRDRVSLTRELLAQLPNLKAIVASDPWVRTIDQAAAADLGIRMLTGKAPEDLPMAPNSNGEFSWALLMATVRNIPQEVARLKQGQWHHALGMSLEGKTLGVLGLGRYGFKMAQYGRTFDMNVIAWSQNLTAEAAAQAGVRMVDKDTLFRESDIVTVQYALSERSRGLVGARELGLMKPTAYLINSSRGPLVDEQALVAALQSRQIAGAGLDVFDEEPLPKDHPLLKLDNVVATPHLGFVTEAAMRHFYVGIASAVTDYLLEAQPA